MKTHKTQSTPKSIEVQVTSASGTTYRALVEKRNKKVTYLCQHRKGEFTKDRKIDFPLTELVATGEYTLPYTKHRKLVEKLFKVKLTIPEQQDAMSESGLADEQVQQPEIQGEAEIEAALWQQIEEERFQEACTTMETQDIEEPPTDEAEVCVQEAPEAAPLPKQHKTCNIILSGETRARAIPDGYVLQAGDRLIRIYKKEIVDVLVKAAGQYEWEGEVYPTLTHISWKVAGYQISGNAFFGLPVKRRGE